jgi:hypothetical protein
MNDLRPALERARQHAPQTSMSLEGIHRARDRQQLRRRVGATVLGFVVTCAIVFGALSVLPGAGTRHAKTLHHGPAEGPSVDISLPDGQFSYQQRIVGFGDEPGVGGHEIATWYGTDGSGRVVYDPGDDATYGAGKYPNDTSDIAQLSTDPSVLEQQLRDRLQPGGASPEPYNDWTYSPVASGPAQEGPITWGLVRSIGDLLDQGMIPEQESAVFQVLANLQGVQVDPSATDPMGRSGIEVTISTEYHLRHWWFDQDSQQMLSSEVLDQEEIVGWSIVERAGVASSTDSTQLDPAYIHDTSGR